jgi:hypothetical protein
MKAGESVSFLEDFLYLICPATKARRKTCALLGKKNSRSKRSVGLWAENHTLPCSEWIVKDLQPRQIEEVRVDLLVSHLFYSKTFSQGLHLAAQQKSQTLISFESI